MTPNFSAPACTHPSPVAALALRPSGACQRERFPLRVPRGRRWPRQRGSTLLPGQAGRFVWRPGPRNGVGGLADAGGRAPSRGGRPTPASRGPGRSPRGGNHSSQISQELDGGREVALVDLLDQLGGVPSKRTDPATPRLPVPINLEAWVMVIMERARPEQAGSLTHGGGPQQVCCHGGQIDPVLDLGPF